MNLQFDSLAELREFLSFAGFKTINALLGDGSTLNGHVRVTADNDSTCIVSDETNTGCGEVHAASAPHTGSQQPDATDPAEVAKNTGGMPGETGEPPKAKRRTKAQIEADKLAAETAQTAGGENAPKGGDSPFDTTQQPLSTEHASVNTTQTQAADTAAQPVDDTDVKLYIADRVGALGAISPVAHLGVARHFISVHSMAPYIRSMQLIDGPGEVAMYNDNHRAQHLAAMEIINRSLGKPALPHEVAAADIGTE